MIESIILGLLRTIGILLLSVISILLFLILVILFLPIIYNININYDSAFAASGKFKILFGLITACVDTQDDEKVVIRVLGVPVKRMKFDKENGDSTQVDLREEETLFKLSVENNDSISKQNSFAISSSDKVNSSLTKNPIAFIKAKISAIIYKVKRIIRNTITMIKNTKNKINMIISFLSDESSIMAFSESKGSLLKFLVHFFPKKSDIVLTFGLEDPSQVGYILAGISPFYGLYGRWLTIEPHFDEKIFKIKGNAKGRIFTFYLLWHLLRVYFNKHVKTLRNKYKTSKA